MPLDPLEGLRNRIEKLEALLRSRFLERSSIDDGQMTFKRSKLKLEDASTLDGEGTFEWSGPWRFDSGDGEIAGDVSLTGDFDLTGIFKSGNVRIEGGKIYVGDMVIDPEDNGGSVVFGDGAKVTANDGAAGVKIESGSGWTAYVAASGIRLGGDVGEASVTLGPELLAMGADRVQIAADELVLGADTGNLADVSHVLARTSSGAARWIPKAQVTG
jgi:hypothetical protein